MTAADNPAKPGQARKHVVFVTWKAGNAPAFEAAARLGHRVTLIRSLRMEKSQNIDFDATPYGRFVDAVHVLEDATDLDALRTRVRAVHAAHPVDGFVATVDALVVPVARIAEELGVPFTRARAAEDAKQKDRCRRVLAAAGLDTTAHALVPGAEEAAAFAARHGYPVVVKPARGSGSEGAHVLADEAELRAVLAGAADRPAYAAGILVEEYLQGRFVSAEIGLSAGRFLRLAVSERSTWHRHEALETGTTIPAALDAADHDRVMEFAEAVVGALGLGLGIFHVEVMLGADGTPRLIECNPRLMGSCLPNLFQLAGGGDIFELLVRIHLDEPVDRPPSSFARYATVRWFGAADAVPRPARAPDTTWAAAEYGPHLHSFTVRFPEGEVLAPCRGNLGNFGEVQVVHPDHDTSIRLAEDIVRRTAEQLGFEVTR
ncbi:phosphoribosylglycinamide formyltransferase 2 [Streptomyces albus]|uniref:Phosphoribosylglycinamide formyltransferase 2 n=1 Tax=Streptomyces albus (strain ATCC 21838 / DSM 41398 / FERM P-419 / JCM 4703 / NBRC 107858) TaxID=1081613 RepID=A0A0B5F092_STRA4|nr:phosphoribosylglycinamide formyltransferase 2 [Streptomyces albus]AOU78589.1 phosphoribosylglycinamide formyltransferase 2 [Streptomyces albus]AYN34330.1 ATP-grasp domain-containing protein [Streptomyces albus]